MNQKTISESKSHRKFSVPQSKFKVSKKGVEGLKILEEALRRTNKTEVKARNQMLWISKKLRQIVSSLGCSLSINWIFIWFLKCVLEGKRSWKKERFAIGASYLQRNQSPLVHWCPRRLWGIREVPRQVTLYQRGKSKIFLVFPKDNKWRSIGGSWGRRKLFSG